MAAYDGLAFVAVEIGGRFYDRCSGLPAYYGPDGEPGGAAGTYGTAEATMPDGTAVGYVPGDFAYADPSRGSDARWSGGTCPAPKYPYVASGSAPGPSMVLQPPIDQTTQENYNTLQYVIGDASFDFLNWLFQIGAQPVEPF